MGGVDISEYLREYREVGEILVRAKWTMVGAESPEEAAIFLRLFADELDALADAGFHLMGPVEDDHGFARRGDESDQDEDLAERHEQQHALRLNEVAPVRS